MTTSCGQTTTAPAPVRPALSDRLRSRVRALLRVLGPAWIVMLADVDAPSVLTAAKAGTDFGYAIPPADHRAHPGALPRPGDDGAARDRHGLGHAELIPERYGFGWGGVAVISMVVIDLLAYTAQFAGIVLGASLIGIAAGPAVVGALVIHSVIVLTRSYRQFEVIAIALSLALFAFVVLAVTTGPDLGAVLGGLSPRQPFDRPGYLDLVVATIGAVIMPWMLFYQQAATVDKGLGPADLPAARAETLVGAIASEVLMAAILIASATAAGFGAGAPSAVGGLALPAGLANLAVGGTAILIAVGIIGSGLLAAVVISLSSAWAWSELFRWPHSLNLSLRQAPAFYGLYLVEVLPAAVVALLAEDLVAVVIDAMIPNVVVLAIPLTFLVRLSSDRTLLGPLANSRWRAALLWALTAGLLGLGMTSAFGLLRPLA